MLSTLNVSTNTSAKVYLFGTVQSSLTLNECVFSVKATNSFGFKKILGTFSATYTSIYLNQVVEATTAVLDSFNYFEVNTSDTLVGNFMMLSKSSTSKFYFSCASTDTVVKNKCVRPITPEVGDCKSYLSYNVISDQLVQESSNCSECWYGYVQTSTLSCAPVIPNYVPGHCSNVSSQVNCSGCYEGYTLIQSGTIFTCSQIVLDTYVGSATVENNLYIYYKAPTTEFCQTCSGGYVANKEGNCVWPITLSAGGTCLLLANGTCQ
ncbi:Hypothetical_protein [Hexamita inflata]|uniref:Hypothetical_protein n=1 Tax=Hexamita inflata TaxID=28002 RepID=A0AA86R4T2_9EUKA|nr:Hypothetical protein HINF_LOCUS59359 [Hexamita inflata]